MTIAIDMRPMAGLNSGIQEYTHQIVSRLVRLSPEDNFKLFFSSFNDTLPDYDWMRADNVKVYRYKFPNRLLFVLNKIFSWPKLDSMVGGADVFFSPHFVLAPLTNSCRRVTTFHDLSFERFPEFFTLNQRLWHWLMGPGRQSRFSDRLIAVSNSTKSDLIHYYHLDPSNVAVVYNASAIVRPSPEQLADFKNKKDLPDRFIFSLGTLEPRKNTAGLVRAFNLLKSKPGFEAVQFIIGGAKGWKCQDVFDEIERSPYRQNIKYIGHIGPEREFYYSLAEVFAYPSFFEGFGLPVLEAMSCGAPVVTSHNSSLPEVAGPAALLVDPYNISAIASALENVLGNKELAGSLSTKSRQQASHFSWDKAALETLQVIHRE